MCISRLSESNLKAIAAQLEQMYREHSRNGQFKSSSHFSPVLSKDLTNHRQLTQGMFCLPLHRVQPGTKGTLKYKPLTPHNNYISGKILAEPVVLSAMLCLCLDMNSALCGVLLKLCATAARLTDRFAMEHALLVALLHSHVGQEVGGWSFVAVCVCVCVCVCGEVCMCESGGGRSVNT